MYHISRWFVIHWLGLATINPPNKTEAYISTHYKDMKDDAKCGKLGGLG